MHLTQIAIRFLTQRNQRTVLYIYYRLYIPPDTRNGLLVLTNQRADIFMCQKGKSIVSCKIENMQ